MLAHERLQALQHRLQETGTVIVSEVAREWDVSEMTIRRDLKRLEDQGVVARIHGGAVASGGLRFTSRMQRYRSEKAAAAAKLAAHLPEHGCIYLDGSTTIYVLAEYLARRGGMQVATNNIDTFQRLAGYPGLQALLIGGVHNRDTDNFVGPLARRGLAGLSFAAAFFSAYALHPRHGAGEPSIDDAEIKQLVCERAERVCLAINHHKLGEQAAGTWAGERERSLLATDLDPTDPRLDPFRDRFATII